MAILQKIAGLTATEYRGPHASFTEADVVKAMVEIGRSSSVGRGKLSELLDLGKGEVRTLIGRLRSSGLIAIGERGCTLTRSGTELFDSLLKSVPWVSEVPGNGLGLGSHYFAAIVKERARKIKMGIEQRDASIKSGSNGTLTVFYSSDHFIIPGELTDSESKGSSETWRKIRTGAPRQGDVIMICGAKSAKLAERGLWSAILTVL